MLELRAENMRLRREVEQLKERLLGMAAGASSGKRVVSGGFRGSAIRASERKGGEVSSAEVEALRQVVNQKNDQIAHMEELLRGLQAEGGAQERSLCELQQHLTDATHQISATAAEREALEHSVEALSTQLNGERQRIEEVQQSAAVAAASNEELLGRLLDLRTQLQTQHEARSGAEEKAAKLEAKLAGMQDWAESLEKTLETKQAEAKQRFACCSSRQRELSVQFLVAARLRSVVLQLCWEAWLRHISERQLGEEVESLRRQTAGEAERAALRSAQSREARARAEVLDSELQRLRKEAQHCEDRARSEATELLDQLESRAAELRAGAAEHDRRAAHALQVRSELADAEAAATALRMKVASLREESTQAEARHEEQQRREEELLAQAKLGRAGSVALQTQLEALRRELEEAKRRHTERDASARKRTEDLERRLQEAQAAVVSATAACDAASSREAALKTRVSDLERRKQELEAAAASTVASTAHARPLPPNMSAAAGQSTASPGEDPSSEREKRIQREETLLRQIRRLEQERDEARAQLQRMEVKVPRPPAGAAKVAGSPRAASPRTALRQAGANCSARTSAPAGSPTWLASASVAASTAAAAAGDATATAAAPAATAAPADSQVPKLEQELATAREAGSQLRCELDELKAQHANGPDPGRLGTELQEVRKAADGMRNELAEARADLSLEHGELRKLRQVRDANEEALAQAKVQTASLKEAQAEAQKWRKASLDAVAQARSSLRILVTAPKVSINVGKTELNVRTGALPRDIEQIRSIVSEKVLPGFQQILAVAEEQGEQDVKKAVQGMVEGLATSVQQEVYRVLPEALV